MTLDQLIRVFYFWGYSVKPDQEAGFRTYLETMLSKGRVMVIEDKEGLAAILTFFLTNDYDALYRKGLWDVPDDNQNGHQIYIDKLVSREYNSPIRRLIQDKIEESFPNVLEGHYHRAPYDRHIVIYRRGSRCLSTS